jgi:hypothetical protein
MLVKEIEAKMINVRTSERGQKFEVRLGGTIPNLLIVGIVNYLRDKKTLRTICGIVGLLSLGVGVLAYLTPDWYLGKMSPPLLIGGFAIFFAAILSGNNFSIYVGELREVQERKEAEKHLSGSKDPFSSLDLDVKRLNEYYAINQSQARGSFMWAIFSMICGFITIIAGIWVFYIKKDTPDAFLTSLSTAGGLVINIISGTFLYLHNKTQKRSLFYYGQLVRIQQVGLAIRLSETHILEEEKLKAKNKIIDDLLHIVKTTSEIESRAAVQEKS